MPAFELGEEPGPHGANFILCIAEVNERKRLWGISRSGELKPLAPVRLIADAIAVRSPRFEMTKNDAMVMRLVEVGLQVLRRSWN